MIQSMTGFGRGAARARWGRATVEIRTLNHRYWEFSGKLPDGLLVLEDRLRDAVHRAVRRGKITLSVVCEPQAARDGASCIDRHAAARAHRELTKLQRGLGLSGAVGLEHLLALPEVVRAERAPLHAPVVWPTIRRALEVALQAVVTRRRAEGQALAREILRRVQAIQRGMQRIQKRAPVVIQEYQRRLEAGMRDLGGGRTADPDRLRQEVALYAESCDIAEEMVRLGCHLAAVAAAVTRGGEVGRKLDFLTQEIYRELNTVGQKARDTTIAADVIHMKGETERIREQVQNVE